MRNTRNNSHSSSKSNSDKGNSGSRSGSKSKPPYDQKRNRPKNKQKNQQKSAKSTPKPRLKIDLYGVHAVTEAWTNPKRHIHGLYITEKALEGFDKALKKAHSLGLKRPSPQIIDKAALDNATASGSVHQGIGLNAQELDEIDIHDIIRAEEPKERSVLIMLDQVTDPHNVGAIIRSSCVFGATGMILQRKHAPELTGVLAKTACGGIEHLPIAYETNLTRSIEVLQKAGYFAIGLAEEGEVELQMLATQHQKLVLVLGAEGDGLRRLVREQCDALVALPTAGPISSLNVSNAAAVALFATTT